MASESGISVIQIDPTDAISTHKKENKCSENAKQYFREYCQNSSIHGVKYIISDNYKRSLCERAWWILSITVMLYLCVIIVLKTYRKWESSPVIVSFATKETPIWEIPFPAVTVCPETKSVQNKFNYTKFRRMKKQNLTLSDEEEEKFGMMSLVCNPQKDINYTSKFKGNGEKIFDFFDEVQPNFYDTISECSFLGEDRNCTHLFFPILTDEGVCYTFNLLDRTQIFRDKVIHYKNYHRAPISKWTLENGYPKEANERTYPRRALFEGVDFALKAELSVYESELDSVCGPGLHGYMLHIAHPARIPRPKKEHFRIPLDHGIMTAISLDMISTSESVKNYVPKRRNCYFPNERPLKYFKIYSQQNCRTECKTNHTLHKCGCANFYMPREAGTPVCGGGDFYCIREAAMDMVYSRVKQKLGKLDNITKTEICDCLPICTKMHYIIENSLTEWHWRKLYNASGKKKYMSFFQIYFKVGQFMTSERNELFGLIDFLANLGGLLGLFIGFSLLSLIEILYYLSLRIICNMKIFGRYNWANTPK